MEIVKELKSDIGVKEIKDIYKKGNKIGIVSNSEVELYSMDTIIDDNEDLIEDLGLDYDDIDIKDFTTNKSVYIEDGTLVAKKDCIIVIDKVVSSECVYIKPFVGKYKDFVITCCLYDNGNALGNKVFEIEI